jgi:hypothetical protein
MLAITEVAPGTHGWTGKPFAGAVKATLTSADAIRPSYRMPSIYMGEIPAAQLDWASNTKIALNIGFFEDASGEALGLALFRRQLGESVYSWIGNIGLPPAGGNIQYQDTSVISGAMYDYAVAVNFSWPGGQGVGGLPGQAGIYSTLARAEAGPFMASNLQPTPTVAATAQPQGQPDLDIPEGWLAYPNPATGPNLFIAIKAEKTMDFRIRGYNLVGEQVIAQRGHLDGRGVHKVAVPIAKFASGIYFLHLDLGDDAAGKVELPVQKIAILH